MAKCRLGKKKKARLEKLTGKKVDVAFVRGGWPHGHAQVFFTDEKYGPPDNFPPMINYHTGEKMKSCAEKQIKQNGQNSASYIILMKTMLELKIR